MGCVTQWALHRSLSSFLVPLQKIFVMCCKGRINEGKRRSCTSSLGPLLVAGHHSSSELLELVLV